MECIATWALEFPRSPRIISLKASASSCKARMDFLAWDPSLNQVSTIYIFTPLINSPTHSHCIQYLHMYFNVIFIFILCRTTRSRFDQRWEGDCHHHPRICYLFEFRLFCHDQRVRLSSTKEGMESSDVTVH